MKKWPVRRNVPKKTIYPSPIPSLFYVLCLLLLLVIRFPLLSAQDNIPADTSIAGSVDKPLSNDNNNDTPTVNGASTTTTTTTETNSIISSSTTTDNTNTNTGSDTKDTTEEADTFAEAKLQEMKEIEEAFQRPEVDPVPNTEKSNDAFSSSSSSSSSTDTNSPDTISTTTNTDSTESVPSSTTGITLPNTPATTTNRQNKRTAPRDEEIYNRLLSKNTRNTVTTTTTSNENLYEDDYYGLNMNMVDNLDRAVFQPSHIFSLEIEPNGMTEFFEDISEEQIGVVIRGDWFVTSGDELNLQAVIHDPTGSRIYTEGPDTPVSDDSGYTYNKLTSDGSFKFRTDQAGTYRLTFFNPSYTSSRTVTFAWLVGKDDDDPYTKKYLEKNSKNQKDSRTDDRTVTPGSSSTDDTTKKHNDLTYATIGMNKATNASATVVMMLKRVSSLHKDIDDITAVQQFADVRFQRHYHTLENTRNRLTYWTLGETLAVIIAASLQIYIVKNFHFVPNQRPAYFVGV